MGEKKKEGSSVVLRLETIDYSDVERVLGVKIDTYSVAGAVVDEVDKILGSKLLYLVEVERGRVEVHRISRGYPVRDQVVEAVVGAQEEFTVSTVSEAVSRVLKSIQGYKGVVNVVVAKGTDRAHAVVFTLPEEEEEEEW